MVSYSIEWKHSATKELKKLPSAVIRRILEAVARLAVDPHPPGSRKLIGSEQAYRIRVGAYRVVYRVEESILLVEIVRVAHRKDVYR